MRHLKSRRSLWGGGIERDLRLYKKDLKPCDICGGTKLHSFNCEKVEV